MILESTELDVICLLNLVSTKLKVILFAGPGEQGRPVVGSKTHNDDAYRENGFNLKVSEQISLNRSLSDIRHPRSVNIALSFKEEDFCLHHSVAVTAM